MTTCCKTRIIISILMLSLFGLQGQNLSYMPLTSGLSSPGFDAGRSDFCLDDINMDGHIDILTIGDHGSPLLGTTMHGICVWMGDGMGNFENFMFGDFGYGGIVVGDVNHDGFKDVGYGMHHNYAATDLGNQILEVALGDGTGMFWTAWDDGLAGNGEDWGMFGTDFGDVDNDGDLDLVSISFGSGAGLHVYLNQGDGTWVQSFGFLNGGSYDNVEFADFNRDGFLDFISTHEFGTIFFGDGTGNFTNNDDGLPILGSFDYRVGISVGDANNDGAADIAIVNNEGGVEVYFWDENISGSWISFSDNLPQSGSFDFTELADLDSDGFMDLAAIENATLSVWTGDGAGNWNFETSIDFDPSADAKAFRVGGDFDQNGRPDMVVLMEEGSWINYNNYMYCFRESSPADSLWIKPIFPNGNENFYPGSAQFIQWASEVPAGENSSVNIEISAFGPDGPWWMLAENIPNNGKHQWTVPDFGSAEVYLKMTVTDEGGNTSASRTENAFTILGEPTQILRSHKMRETAHVSPNPGNDYISFTLSAKISRIKFYDVSGKCVLDQSSNFEHIFTGNLKNGMYFYRLFNDNQTMLTGKWVKQNP